MSDGGPGPAPDEDEPGGSDADRLEQAAGDDEPGPPAPTSPPDLEVPIADAWEQAQPVAGDEDDRRG